MLGQKKATLTFRKQAVGDDDVREIIGKCRSFFAARYLIHPNGRRRGGRSATKRKHKHQRNGARTVLWESIRAGRPDKGHSTAKDTEVCVFFDFFRGDRRFPLRLWHWCGLRSYDSHKARVRVNVVLARTHCEHHHRHCNSRLSSWRIFKSTSRQEAHTQFVCDSLYGGSGCYGSCQLSRSPSCWTPYCWLRNR